MKDSECLEIVSLILNSLSYSTCVIKLKYQQRRKKLAMQRTSQLTNQIKKNGTTGKIQVRISACSVLLVSLSYQSKRWLHNMDYRCQQFC